jgi:2-polyprenyl-3-methyl-5-hydroxy-6-metoxy-1,4-benzoquinol methylase
MITTAYELSGCPVCQTTDASELAGPETVREEMESLWAFHTRRLAGATPPEHLVDRVAFSQRPPLRVVRCEHCGLVYRNPRERAFELGETYAGEAPDEAALEALFETQKRSYAAQVRRLTRRFGRKGSGLEVGSYVGGFLAAARDEGWQFEGLDVNEHAVRFARGRGFSATVGDLDAFDDDRRFDVVAIWNCFDQLPDPRAAAHAARARLEENGMLALRVPNGGFYAAVRQALDGPLAGAARALLAHNNLLGFPYRHGFTPDSLGLLLDKTGFRVAHVHGDALVPIADEWTRPWAAVEERALKAILRAIGSVSADRAPWFEVYARPR